MVPESPLNMDLRLHIEVLCGKCQGLSHVLWVGYRLVAFFLVVSLCGLRCTAQLGRRGADRPTTRYYNFEVNYANFTRLNHTKPMIVVNGQFPGPPIHAHEGDTLVINVTNLVAAPITIHWHGVRQLRTGWADGVPYITQCPLLQNVSYTHKFQLPNQTGTLWYHAHISWLRATIHGAIIVQPRKSQLYPFPRPTREIPVILGEWWNRNVEDILADAMAQGGGYNISDALIINGQPGFLYNFSSADAFKVKVRPGKTYLLRVINACMNFGLFFGVANHSLTVLQMDSAYVEPFTVDTILIAPGQTLDAMLTANRTSGKFYMAATPFSLPNVTRVPFPTIPATARLEYLGSSHASVTNMPTFPAYNDSSYRDYYDALQLSRNTTDQALDVPQEVDKHLFFTVGYALASRNSCPPYKTCGGFDGDRLLAAVNNISFVTPNTTKRSLLEYAYLHDRGVNVSSSNLDLTFPSYPKFPFNYTSATKLPVADWFPEYGTKLSVIDFNSSVQLVLQDTNILIFETHPFHLHGYSFFVVGMGYGNYDAIASPKTFNLVNPPLRNTFGVRSGGWIALRFRADNPGVWLLHCHLEIHISWGMETLLFVREGTGANETLPAPPKGYPTCGPSPTPVSTTSMPNLVLLESSPPLPQARLANGKKGRGNRRSYTQHHA